MPDRILASHAGSLPRPEDLIALNERRVAADFAGEEQYLVQPLGAPQLLSGLMIR